MADTDIGEHQALMRWRLSLWTVTSLAMPACLTPDNPTLF